jgi:hypothetical protein
MKRRFAFGRELSFAKTRRPRQRAGMSTAQEIKGAIDQLPVEERAKLIAELCGWTDDDWDRRMKADAAAGKFNALNEDAAAAYRAGQTQPLDEGRENT